MAETISFNESLLPLVVDHYQQGSAPAVAAKKLLPLIGEHLWGQFEDCPISSIDEIECPFGHFPIGTERFDVWLWFEETFGLEVGTELKVTS